MIRKMIASVVAVLSLVLGTMAVGVAPAHAYDPPTVSLGHWSNGKWGPGTETTWPYRWFYVLDRSGDPTIGAALQHVINDLQYDLNARNAWGIVPAPIYLNHSDWVGQCDSTPYSGGNGFQSLSGFSFITVCSGGRGGGSSVTWTSGGHHAEGYHPSMHIQREYPDYNSTYSHLAHELLHAMGVDHTSNCNDLMGGSEFGCVIRAGVLQKPSGADYDALTNFYGGYGFFNHPWNA